MTKIKNYALDLEVRGDDKWIGTDSGSLAKLTKNFTPDNLAKYYNDKEVVESVNQLRFFYDTVAPGEDRARGSFSFPTEVGAEVPFSEISNLVFSRFTLGDDAVNNFMTDIVNSIIILQKADNPDIYAFYALNGYEVDPTDSNFYNVELSYESGNGSVQEDQDYFVSLIQFAGAAGIQTILGSEFIESTLTGVGEVTLSLSATGTADDTTYLRGDNTWANIVTDESDLVFYTVKNSSGTQILKGKAVMAVGTDGNSGHILIDEFVADGSIEPKYFMGVLEDTLDNGEFGRVLHFGELRQFNTLGQNGETWNDGDVLWCDPANPGDFTLIEPLGPNVKIAAAIVINAANNGKIKVRVQGNEGIKDLYDTRITPQTDGDVLVWNDTDGVWFNDSTLNVDYTNSRVGIGTTSPSKKLDVNGDIRSYKTTGTAAVIAEKDSNFVSLKADGTSGFIEYGNVVSGNRVLRVIGNGSEVIRIDTSGNVGIGTTSPGAKLHVQGTTILGDTFNTVTSYINKLEIPAVFGDQGGNRLSIAGPGTTVTEGPAIISDGRNLTIGSYDNGAIDSGIRFNHINNTPNSDTVEILAASAVKLIVSASGNVGIGTTSPQQLLDITNTTAAPVLRLSRNQNINGTMWAGQSLGDIEFYTNDGSFPAVFGKISVIGGPDSGTPNSGYPDGHMTFYTRGQQGGNVLGERMRITDTGNVGIGTTSPTSNLHIYSTGNGLIQTERAFGALVFMRAQAATGVIGTTSNHRLDLSTNGGVRATIDTNGNVGIGTTSPSQKLDVAGNIALSTAGYIYGDTTIPSIRLSDAGGASLNYGASSLINGGSLVFNVSGNTKFRISSSGGGYVSSGNFGIGTTSPSARLEVQGGTTLSAIGFSGPTVKIGDYTGIGTTRIFSNGSYIGYSTANGYHDFSNAGASQVRITSAGRVGIGTTNPNSELDVEGRVDFAGDIRLRGQSSSLNIGVARLFVDAANSLFIDPGNAGTALSTFKSTGAIQLGNYGSGTFTGTATQRLAVDSSGNVIEIPIGSGPVDGSGTANYLTKWSDADTIAASSILQDIAGYKVQGQSGANYTRLQLLAPAGKYLTLFEMTHGSDDNNSSAVVYGRGDTFPTINSLSRGTGVTLPINFAIDSSEKMRIHTNGNVGIGTTSPSEKLDVVGNIKIGTNRLKLGGGNADSYIQHDGSNLITFFQSNWGGDFKFRAADISGTQHDILFIEGSSQNVGVGTTSPDEKLRVDGNIKAAGDFIGSALKLGFAGTANITTNDTDEDLLINPNGIGDILMQTSSGNVGIGTTSPSQKLDILADISGAGGISITNANTGSSSLSTITVNNGTTGYGGALNYIPPTYTAFPVLTNYVDLAAYSQTNGFIIRTSGSGNIKFLQGGINAANERFTINTNDVTVNTGLSNVDFRVKGTSGDVLFVDASAGNVGIGTTSPIVPLHVIGDTVIEDTSAVLTLKSTQVGSTSSIQFESLANAAIIGGGTADYLSFMTASNHRMRILANGNVGIGTTSPGQKLHVVGEGKIQGNLMIGSSGDTAGAIGQLHIKGSNAQTIVLEDTDNANLVVKLSAEETVGFKIEDTTHSNVLFFGDQSGNVGIGTTSPLYKLDVNGNARIGSTLTVSSASDATSFIYLLSSPTGESEIRMGDTDTDAGAIAYNNNTDTMVFRTGAANRVYIDSSGNVGIGTTSPTQTLDVSGSVIFRPSGTSDTISFLSLGSAQSRLVTTGNFAIWPGGNEAIRLLTNGYVGIGTSSPASKLDVNGGIRMADDTATASATNEGTLRYRKDANNSYIDMCMQTGASTYAWVNIKTNTW